AHRLRRPDRTGRRAAPLPRVSSSQHGVNIAGVRH
ncbi:GntR family transcriptional regulator, partial [Streptomyces fulvissimus]|nr:GntR family transcriptional regulator [Streptomyces microflavus]